MENQGSATASQTQGLTTASVKPSATTTLSFTLNKDIAPIASSNGDYDSTDNPMTGDMELTRFATTAPGTLEDSQQTEDKFYFGYYVSGETSSPIHWRTNQFSSSTPKHDFWRIYKVEFSIPSSQEQGGVTYDQAGIFAMIKDTPLAVTVAPDNSSKAYLWKSDSSKTMLTAAGTNGSVTLSDTTNGDKFSTAASKLTYYIGVYVDGGDSVTTVAPTGDFVVNIAPK